MRPIHGQLFLIFILYFNEIETSNLPSLNLGSPYTDEDLRRIAPLSTSRVGGSPITRNLMPQPSPAPPAWYDGLNLYEPPERGPSPDTDLRLGMPGTPSDHSGSSEGSNNAPPGIPSNYLEHPQSYRNNNNQQRTYHHNLNHHQQPNYQSHSSAHIAHAGGSGYGNNFPYAGQQTVNQYGQIIHQSHYPAQMHPPGGSGYRHTFPHPGHSSVNQYGQLINPAPAVAHMGPSGSSGYGNHFPPNNLQSSFQYAQPFDRAHPAAQMNPSGHIGQMINNNPYQAWPSNNQNRARRPPNQ